MKNFKKVAAFTVIIAAITLVLTACSLFAPNTPKIPHIEKRYVILELNGGSGVSAKEFVLDDDLLVAPANIPIRNGYRFKGWFTDKELTEAAVFDVPIRDVVYIFAAWEKRDFEGYFICGEGNEDVTVSAVNGTFAPPTAERKGYNFGGWYMNAALTEKADFTAIKDTTFYSKWTAVSYTINYDCDGLASMPLGAKRSYTIEDKVIFDDPSKIKSGYEFLGWYVDGQKVTTIEKGAIGNVNLKAKFLSRNKEVVSVKGGTVDGDTVFAGLKNSQTDIVFGEVITVSDRARFVVTNSEDRVITSAENLDEGQTEYTLKVTAEDGTEKTYKLVVTRYDASRKEVVFNYFDSAETEYIFMGDCAAIPTERNVTGYTFVGWFKDDAKKIPYDFNLPIVSDITIYSKYAPIEYSISYNSGMWDTDTAALRTYTIEDAVSLIPPYNKNGTDTRYEFLGWYEENGKKVEVIPEGTTEDVELFAKFKIISEKRLQYLTADYSALTEVDYSIINDYLIWCVWNRFTEKHVVMNVPLTVDPKGVMAYMNAGAGVAMEESNVVNSMAWENGTYKEESNRYRYEFDFKVSYVLPTQPASTSGMYEQIPYIMHEFSTPSDSSALAIDSVVDTVSVSDSDQLYYAVINGYNPKPKAGSAAERIYGKATKVLAEITDESMTDIEISHAVYDWLIDEVIYDYRLLEISPAGNISAEQMAEFKKYNGFALEGVFDDGRAVCDGISKAMALMCNMAGIQTVRVVGDRGSVGHAWNKLKIDGNWYNADATSGGPLLRVKSGNDQIAREGMTHKYFLVSDEYLNRFCTPEEGKHGYTDLKADAVFDIYSAMEFEWKGKTYDYNITSPEEWYAAAEYIKSLMDSKNLNWISADFVINATQEECVNHISLAFSAQGLKFAAFFDEKSSVVTLCITTEEI